MELQQAIEMLKKTVKNNGTNDSNHIDLGLVPVELKEAHAKALRLVKVAIIEGKITQADFEAQIGLN